MTQKTARVSVRIDAELVERLRARAEGAERSMAYLVRRILKEWLERDSAPPKPRTR